MDVCIDQATVAITNGDLTLSVEECTPANSSHPGMDTTSSEMSSIVIGLYPLTPTAYIHNLHQPADVLVFQNDDELKRDKESHHAFTFEESTNLMSAASIYESTCTCCWMSGLYCYMVC